MQIESKRKLAGDLGDFVGCAFDFCFEVPLESRAVQESVGRLFPAYKETRYTGFGDANFIAARDGIWFFEKCERFGYNAHPTLLWTLNRDPLAETFASLVDGTFAPNVAPGFGASCTMYMDHRLPGKVIQFPPSIARDLYLYDVYQSDDLLFTAGYYDDVLIATAFGYDPDGMGRRAGKGTGGQIPRAIVPHRRRRDRFPVVADPAVRGSAGDGISVAACAGPADAQNATGRGYEFVGGPERSNVTAPAPATHTRGATSGTRTATLNVTCPPPAFAARAMFSICSGITTCDITKLPPARKISTATVGNTMPLTSTSPLSVANGRRAPGRRGRPGR